MELGALDWMDDPIAVVKDDRVVFANRALALLGGRDRSALVGESLEHALPGEARCDERCVVAADGSERLFRVTERAIDDGSRLVVLREVTRERALQVAGKSAEDRYQLLAEQTVDVVSRHDTQGVCLYVSPSCRHVLGYEPEELLGRTGFDFAFQGDAPGLEEALRRSLDHGRTGEPIVSQVRRKDGTLIWLQSHCQMERDADGRVVAIRTTARDVTARVNAEVTLSEVETSFRELVNGMPEPIAILVEGRLAYVNPALARLLRYARPAEIVGREMLEIVHQGDRDYVVEREKDPRRWRAPSREYRLLRRDGKSVPVFATAFPIVFDGRLAGFAAFHDLSDKKNLESQLVMAERMAVLGRVCAGVGHEIGNPLAYALATLDLLDRAVAGKEDAIPHVREHLQRLREGCDHIREIVRDLRTVARPDMPSPGLVDVHEVLDACVRMAEHEIRPRARLVRRYERLPAIRADEGRLAQVFLNLIVNAAQAIPEGAVHENTIEVCTKPVDGGRVSIEISDTGTGIAPDVGPHVFEPFFTTKDPSVGTGLGLSICYRVVSSMDGTLRFEPNAPRGTRFRVVLPMVARRPSAPTHPDGGRRRVLVVDDEPRMAEAVAGMLDEHDVQVATGGSEALARLAIEPFDAVVCDLHMPEVSGMELYERLAERAPSIARRVVFMTGGVASERARSFLREVAPACLYKPFERDELVAAITKVFDTEPRGLPLD